MANCEIPHEEGQTPKVTTAIHGPFGLTLYPLEKNNATANWKSS
jgi:hypothetical protein